MELFEQIRREYEFGVGTIAGVSRKLGVHRRMVREALAECGTSSGKPNDDGFASWMGRRHFIDRVLRAICQHRRSSVIRRVALAATMC